MVTRAWPRKITIEHDSRSASWTNISDAETRLPLDYVVKVVIELRRHTTRITLTGATTTPPTKTPNITPQQLNEDAGAYDFDGIVVEDKTYLLTSINAEGGL